VVEPLSAPKKPILGTLQLYTRWPRELFNFIHLWARCANSFVSQPPVLLAGVRIPDTIRLRKRGTERACLIEEAVA
jgi:hypothetical protein